MIFRAIFRFPIAPQVLQGYYGMVIIDSSAASADIVQHRCDFSLAALAVGSTTALCRMGTKSYSAGTFLLKGERAFNTEGGTTLTLTAIGTDTTSGAGLSKIAYAFDTTTYAGQIRLTITNSGTGTSTALNQCSLDLTGPLATFIEGTTS